MPRARRIFAISDFKDESPRSVFLEERRMVKGLVRLGHDVQRFSCRNIMTQFNPFSGKHLRRFMPRFVRRVSVCPGANKYSNAGKIKRHLKQVLVFAKK